MRGNNVFLSVFAFDVVYYAIYYIESLGILDCKVRFDTARLNWHEDQPAKNIIKLSGCKDKLLLNLIAVTVYSKSKHRQTSCALYCVCETHLRD